MNSLKKWIRIKKDGTQKFKNKLVMTTQNFWKNRISLRWISIKLWIKFKYKKYLMHQIFNQYRLIFYKIKKISLIIRKIKKLYQIKFHKTNQLHKLMIRYNLALQ